MKVTVDKTKCVSAGNCVANAPDVFDQDEDDGSVVLLDETPPPEYFEAVRAAVLACPASVIGIAE